MPRILKSLCLLLALLWVPITQHCLLKAVVEGATTCGACRGGNVLP